MSHQAKITTKSILFMIVRKVYFLSDKTAWILRGENEEFVWVRVPSRNFSKNQARDTPSNFVLNRIEKNVKYSYVCVCQ